MYILIFNDYITLLFNLILIRLHPPNIRLAFCTSEHSLGSECLKWAANGRANEHANVRCIKSHSNTHTYRIASSYTNNRANTVWYERKREHIKNPQSIVTSKTESNNFQLECSQSHRISNNILYRNFFIWTVFVLKRTKKMVNPLNFFSSL